MDTLIKICTEAGVKRIVISSAWGVGDSRKDIPWWFRWTIEHSNIRYPYEDHHRQEERLKTSGLDWTAVRAVGLTNSARKKDVKTSINHSAKPSLLIGRHNLARFMVDILENSRFVYQTPVVFE